MSISTRVIRQENSMGSLGISDTTWVKLLANTTAVCWLFPEHEGLETLRNTMTEFELENPELVLQILSIVEDKYNDLDGEIKENVDSLREQYKN